MPESEPQPQPSATGDPPPFGQQVETVLDLVTDGVVAIDRNWRIRYVNRSYLKLVESLFGRSELIGADVWTRFPDIVDAPVGRFMREAMECRTETSMEFYYARLDRWLLVRAHPSDEQLILVVSDRSERQRGEERLVQVSRKLQEQSQIFDALLNSIPDLAYAFDTELRVLYANEPLLQIWGCSLEEARGKTCHELDYPPDLADRLMEQMREVIRSKRRFEGETVYAGEYNDYIYSPAFDADGRVVAVVGTTRLVTKRRRMAAVSDGQRRVLQLLAQNAPLEKALGELVLTAEISGEPDMAGSILLVDESSTRLVHGAAPTLSEEFNRAIVPLAIGPNAGTCGAAAWRREPVLTIDISADPAWEGGHQYAQREGLRACWSTPLLSSAGELLGTFAMYFRTSRAPTEEEMEMVETVRRTAAITIERKWADRRAERARDEALEASRAKDAFIASLSHELRTPLNPVLLLASEAMNDERLSPEVRGLFETVMHNVTLEARLIDDLLDLSRITSGKMALRASRTDLHALLTETLGIVLEEFADKQVASSLRLEAPQAVTVCDPTRLQQVFWNLLKNAVKFTPAGGRVEIVTQAAPERESILISVTDSGHGMTAEEIKRAFLPFSQGEHAGTGASPFGGLGVGLALARSIVELHRGEITATSEGRRKGTTVTVRLPLITPPPGDGEPPARPTRPVLGSAPVASIPPAGRGRRVLLVEDHPASRAGMKKLLERRGWETIEAGSIEEALAAARARPPFDLLISDIGLPDGDGYELSRRLAALALRPAVSVALTGYGTESDITLSREAGFRAHLTKPISVPQLDELLAKFE